MPALLQKQQRSDLGFLDRRKHISVCERQDLLHVLLVVLNIESLALPEIVRYRHDYGLGDRHPTVLDLREPV